MQLLTILALGLAPVGDEIRLVDLVPGTESVRREAALEAVGASGDEAYVLPLLDLLRHALTAEEWYLVLDTLTPLIGEDARRLEMPWRTLWNRRLASGPPGSAARVVPDDYREFRTELLARTVDVSFRRLLDENQPSLIPFEEIQWGGVEVDGIPALEDPAAVTAAEATFLGEDARVFGIVLNGEARAYPGLVLDWHEMANDVLGGVPLSLTWCTLCGAPIAYRAVRGTQPDRRDQRLRFGSSGLLYRSNKLMFDRSTETLWNQLTGRPVLGPRVASGDTSALKRIPVRTTTWKAWRTAYPETTVVTPETGHDRDYSPGAAYGEYFASPSTMFPVPSLREASFEPKEPIFVAYGPAGAFAASITSIRATGVLRLGSGAGAVTVVELTRAQNPQESRAEEPPTIDAAAYATGARKFRRDGDLHLLDEEGIRWQITPGGLRGPGEEVLSQVDGHPAFGFAWEGQLVEMGPDPTTEGTREQPGSTTETAAAPSPANAPRGDRSPR